MYVWVRACVRACVCVCVNYYILLINTFFRMRKDTLQTISYLYLYFTNVQGPPISWDLRTIAKEKEICSNIRHLKRHTGQHMSEYFGKLSSASGFIRGWTFSL